MVLCLRSPRSLPRSRRGPPGRQGRSPPCHHPPPRGSGRPSPDPGLDIHHSIMCDSHYRVNSALYRVRVNIALAWMVSKAVVWWNKDKVLQKFGQVYLSCERDYLLLLVTDLLPPSRLCTCHTRRHTASPRHCPSPTPTVCWCRPSSWSPPPPWSQHIGCLVSGHQPHLSFSPTLFCFRVFRICISGLKVG